MVVRAPDEHAAERSEEVERHGRQTALRMHVPSEGISPPIGVGYASPVREDHHIVRGVKNDATPVAARAKNQKNDHETSAEVAKGIKKERETWHQTRKRGKSETRVRGE